MNAARAASFVVWAVVGLSAAYWGMKALGAGTPVPAHAQWVVAKAPQRADLTRLWGADAPAPVAAEPQVAAQDSRFRLIGVVAARQNPAAPGGVALLAVDGKAPRAFRTGQNVSDGWVLQAVGPRSAELGPAAGAAAVKLELPALAPASTGVLAPAAPN